jgi:hypothetical protein
MGIITGCQIPEMSIYIITGRRGIMTATIVITKSTILAITRITSAMIMTMTI